MSAGGVCHYCHKSCCVCADRPSVRTGANMSKTIDAIGQEKINTIMDQFDFKLCHQVAKSNQWAWGYGDNAHIPDAIEMRKVARRLLEYAWVEDVMTSTGRFTAIRVHDKLYLNYHVEEAMSCD